MVYWTDHIQDSKNVQMVVSGERHALFLGTGGGLNWGWEC